MKFTNFKTSRESIFPIDNITHVRSRKTFYHISVHFRYPGFRSVTKPRKPVLIFRTSPTTNKLPMCMINFIIIYDMVNLFSIKMYKSSRKLRVGMNRYTGVNWSTTTMDADMET